MLIHCLGIKYKHFFVHKSSEENASRIDLQDFIKSSNHVYKHIEGFRKSYSPRKMEKRSTGVNRSVWCSPIHRKQVEISALFRQQPGMTIWPTLRWWLAASISQHHTNIFLTIKDLRVLDKGEIVTDRRPVLSKTVALLGCSGVTVVSVNKWTTWASDRWWTFACW